MKSTPTRGVKQYLKPNAYNQWEPSLQINQETDMYYVYVLRSERGGHYIGYSADLKRRLAEHNEGKNVGSALLRSVSDRTFGERSRAGAQGTWPQQAGIAGAAVGLIWWLGDRVPFV